MFDHRSHRIGVLLDHIDSDYHVDVVRGALRAGHLARVKVLIITGGWLGKANDPKVTRNFIYDLLTQAKIDGLVIMAGSLSNACGIPQFIDWVQRFNGIPVVMAGLDVPNTPSVFVDNEAGLYKVITHLISDHKRRRIAFVGGSESSPEVAARRRAYFSALANQGIELDDRLLVTGNLQRDAGGLSREAGALAIAELLDERHLAPATLDAVVGANDDIALGAMDELNRRGISVPNSMAVVGFDDAATARASNPPLTTVNQQVSQQTFIATQKLINSIEHGTPSRTESIESVPVIRVSCGCAVRFTNDTVDSTPASLALARSCRLALIERRARISAELSRAASGRLVGMTGWESRLLDSLVRDLATGEVSAFMGEVEALVRRHVVTGNDVTPCHDVLTSLRQQAVTCAAIEPTIRPHLEDMFQEARTAIARLAADFERDHHRQLTRQLRLITKAALSLCGHGSTTELATTLLENLPAMGIRAYSISRFTDGCDPNGTLEVLARHALAIGFSPGNYLLGKDLGIDAALEQEEAVVVSPLDFEDTPVGIAAFSWGAHNPLHYEQLREVLGAAINCHGYKHP